MSVTKCGVEMSDKIFESERPIMSLFTVGSLIICVDLELFVPAKEAYLDLMGLDHSTNIG